MIHIYRSNYDSVINKFHGREYVNHDEVEVKVKKVFGEEHVYAEPKEPGSWAFGGTFLYTSNGCFPAFNKPIPLHDRNMNLEG